MISITYRLETTILETKFETLEDASKFMAENDIIKFSYEMPKDL